MPRTDGRVCGTTASSRHPACSGSLVMPGNVGGMNWSGYAYDASRHLLIVNTNNLAAKVKLVPQAVFNDPAQRTEKGEYTGQAGTPYGMFRTFLMSARRAAVHRAALGHADGARSEVGNDPLAGAARELQSGEPERAARRASAWAGRSSPPAASCSSPGRGIRSLRAFDIETGKEVWKATLPFGGHATPMTYQTSTDGKQYVVIAAGGHGKIDEAASRRRAGRVRASLRCHAWRSASSCCCWWQALSCRAEWGFRRAGPRCRSSPRLRDQRFGGPLRRPSPRPPIP